MITPSDLTPLEVYHRLLTEYGRRGWWPVTDESDVKPTVDPGGLRGRPPLMTEMQQWEVMVGALLTQNTTWVNVQKALVGLREAGFDSLRSVAKADHEALAKALRPSGYYNQKAQRLQLLARHLQENWGGSSATFLNRPTSSVRAELLAQKGIGRETADSILLYAGNGHHTIFVVDAYTYRLAERLGWDLTVRDYDAHQAFFMERLEPETQLFNEYHALIVKHAQARCRARRPICDGCPLREGFVQS